MGSDGKHHHLEWTRTKPLSGYEDSTMAYTHSHSYKHWTLLPSLVLAPPPQMVQGYTNLYMYINTHVGAQVHTLNCLAPWRVASFPGSLGAWVPGYKERCKCMSCVHACVQEGVLMSCNTEGQQKASTCSRGYLHSHLFGLVHCGWFAVVHMYLSSHGLLVFT